MLTGDGAAQDIGLQSTMAAIHRNLDFYYFCYDNEAYGNTGFQTSASTPYVSRTATCPITPLAPLGNVAERRDLLEIWRVQKPPYLATVSAAYPLDLSEKVYRAEKFKGPKLFIALILCPPGWDIDPEWSVEVARLAVETGIWPLKKRFTARSLILMCRTSNRLTNMSYARGDFAISSTPSATIRPSRKFRRTSMNIGKMFPSPKKVRSKSARRKPRTLWLSRIRQATSNHIVCRFLSDRAHRKTTADH